MILAGKLVKWIEGIDVPQVKGRWYSGYYVSLSLWLPPGFSKLGWVYNIHLTRCGPDINGWQEWRPEIEMELARFHTLEDGTPSLRFFYCFKEAEKAFEYAFAIVDRKNGFSPKDARMRGRRGG